MHPDTHAAPEGLHRIGQPCGDKFSQTEIHEGCEIKMACSMPDANTFDLEMELLGVRVPAKSMADSSSSNIYFPAEFNPTTGPYGPHMTNSVEQMAGVKRQLRDDGAYKPEPKRRVAPGGRGGKNNKPVTLLSQNKVRGAAKKNQKPVIIDLSDDEGRDSRSGVQTSTAIIKALPPNSPTGQFPCFDAGEVYIIIDPENILYQYRLHKSTLSRVSPKLGRILNLVVAEAVEDLKIVGIDAEARLDLIDSKKLGRWALKRTPFTLPSQAVTLLEAFPADSAVETSDLPNQANGQIPSHIICPSTSVDFVTSTARATTPGVLASGIVADHIKVTEIIKDQGGDFCSNEAIDVFDREHGEQPSLENQIQSLSSETAEKLINFDEDTASVKTTNASLDMDMDSSVEHGGPEEAEHDLSKISNTDTDQIGRLPGDYKDVITLPADEEVSIATINSSSGKESGVLVELSTPDSVVQEQPSSLIATDNSLEILVTEPAKPEEIPATNAAQDESIARIDSPEPASFTSSAEVSSDQGIDQSINISSKPISRRPSLEVCEAYHNLFLIFYNKAPIISTTSISLALKQCEMTISIAQTLDTVAMARPYLANAIGRYGQQLYIAVASEPFRWLKLSIILESAAIFKESIIHIVGGYTPGPTDQFNLPIDIPESVRQLILTKIRIQDQERMDANEYLFSSSIIIDSKLVTFPFADTSFLSTWLVVQTWRDWFCRQLIGCHRNPHLASQLYHTLLKGGDAYLPASGVKAMIEKVRESIEIDVVALEEDLELLKTFAQEKVGRLCANHSMLDVQEAGIGYLTCARVLDEDLPWFEAEQQ